MSLDHINLNVKQPRAKQVRKLVSSEEHVLELKLLRKDGTGNLAVAVVDLTRGSATVRQETQPITYKTAKDVEDVIEFYTTIKARLEAAPAPVLSEPVAVEDEGDAAVAAPASA